MQHYLHICFSAPKFLLQYLEQPHAKIVSQPSSMTPGVTSCLLSPASIKQPTSKCQILQREGQELPPVNTTSCIYWNDRAGRVFSPAPHTYVCPMELPL